MYVGPTYVEGDDNLKLCEELSSVGKDYNGDGNLYVQFTDILYYNEKQIEARKQSANNKGEAFVFDGNINALNYEKFSYEVMNGQSVIYLLDPDIYETIKGDNIFVKLEDVFGIRLNKQLDDYSIKLEDTAFYSNNEYIKLLPGDTVVCMRKVMTMSYFTGRVLFFESR